MKKIGREVLMLSTDEVNSRNGEGALIRLRDGRIMYAYTEYYGDGWMDCATARLSVTYSADEGESWSAPEVLLEKEGHQQNIMSVSLVRCGNGDLGMLYLQKLEKEKDHFYCMPLFRYSTDEGKSWSDAVDCIEELGYYVVNNDRVVRLKSGRLLVPVAHHGEAYDSVLQLLTPATIRIIYSDDNGRSWDVLPARLSLTYEDGIGLQEPGIYEYEDGRLWLWCRTAYGYQYQSFSSDGGMTWSQITPNFHFTSPDSPMQVKKLSKCTLAIFNPFGFNCMSTLLEYWNSPKRTPFVCAVSTDDGRSFDTSRKKLIYGDLNAFTQACYLLEDDVTNSYCYPAILEVEGGFLVAYYHSNGSRVCLNSAKIAKVSYSELGIE